jgi:hypothetical protein
MVTDLRIRPIPSPITRVVVMTCDTESIPEPPNGLRSALAIDLADPEVARARAAIEARLFGHCSSGAPRHRRKPPQSRRTHVRTTFRPFFAGDARGRSAARRHLLRGEK